MEYTNAKFEINRNNMIEHFKEMMQTSNLFLVDIDKDEIYKKYLDSFPKEIKETYRTNPWHDCTVCRRFIQQYGNIIAIDENYNIISLFNFPTNDEYAEVMKSMDEYITSLPIISTFYSSKNELGVKENFEMMEDGTVEKHSHFYLQIPDTYICDGKKIDKYKSDDKANKEVLKGSLEKISIESVDTVIELIENNQLYRGDEWLNILRSFRTLLIQYNRTTNEEREKFLWKTSKSRNVALNRIKNHSIGVLLKDLTKGKDLEYAVKKYENIVAPTNYKRPQPLFTQAMLDAAEEKITELGYLESIPRRFAKLSDISINDILYANRNVKKDLKDNIFKELSKDAVNKPKKFDNVDEITINDFIEHILPTTIDIEVYFENKHCNNLVSLIAPINEDSKTMFKWDNNFSWAYNHNLADSMKQRVKAMGGDVDVDLRFSIQWNDTGIYNENDLDAHCTTPNGEEIYYHNMRSLVTDGWLDVDIINPQRNKVAVENIRFKHREDMVDGEYLFRVHQYTYRDGDDGFRAEIEFDGEIYSFDYPHTIRQDDYVDVAKVTFKDGKFSIDQLLNAKFSNKKEWNITTNNFIPVNLICYSPNHWDSSTATGNKHIFFMVKDCINDTRPNAWYNEYLNNELNEHRKVMEALGYKAKVEESEDQLSGIGFSLTKHDELIVKADNHIYKIKI